MTIFLPLEAHTPLPSTPPFLIPSPNVQAHLQRVISAIVKAKRIVVICGAGISVQAGIPDFRSPEGLFRTLKRDNPREALASGKDLFDASVFNAEHTTSLFCQMIAQLSKLSQNAEPTAFHHVLRALDDQGKLLRVYTQNIDAIEQKAGLSFGVPGFEDRRARARARAGGKVAGTRVPASVPVPVPVPASSDNDNQTSTSTATPTPATTRLPSPPIETPRTPRCIPLHGTLQSVHCQVCTYSFPLLDHLPSLEIGHPPPCPECTNLERTRQLVGKRPRGVGKLRPSVVLYNEAHKDGEGVGQLVSRDLMGSKGRCGADLLLVVGTSLRVPGTKRMVREFAKAVKSRGGGGGGGGGSGSSSSGGAGVNKEDVGGTMGSAAASNSTPNSSSSSSSSSRTSGNGGEEEPAMKAVYLNLDFPMPTREWEGVFDVWLQGDAQQFADLLNQEIQKQAKTKEIAIEKKRKRDEEAALAAATEERLCLSQVKQQGSSLTATTAATTTTTTPKPPKPKRRSSSDSTTTKSTTTTGAKRRKAVFPPSPPKSPRHASSSSSGSATPEEGVDPAPSPALPTLIIRIPPLAAARARVCYVEPPSLSQVFKTPNPSRDAPPVLRLPPTPEETPPMQYKSVPGRPPLTPPHSFGSSPYRSKGSFVREERFIDVVGSDSDSDAMDVDDNLPVSCLRSTQRPGFYPDG